jgi:hypothetical protein
VRKEQKKQAKNALKRQMLATRRRREAAAAMKVDGGDGIEISGRYVFFLRYFQCFSLPQCTLFFHIALQTHRKHESCCYIDGLNVTGGVT